MDTNVRKLLEMGDKLFSDRLNLDQLWQEVALNFFPEMAEFTSTQVVGTDWASHLTTSYPLLARRSLGDALSSLLRPVTLDTTSPGVWMSMRSDHAEDRDSQAWLEKATIVQRKKMYERGAQFVRATKEGDHSFATFGQCVISVELNQNRDTLLYRSWHLKDVVWAEDAEGKIDRIFRKWKPTVSQLVNAFGNRVSDKIKNRLDKDGQGDAPCYHIVMTAEAYKEVGKSTRDFKTPWVSIWVDKENDHVMEESGSFSPVYVIPRWVTIPGSQYASSPAVTAALPDARLIQAMTLTMLEASEKYADPPMVATQEAVRSDINLFSGGVTWVDNEYDERLGRPLAPVYDAKAGDGLRLGMELRADVKDTMAKAFFLDSLALPPSGVKEMTAFEVGQRISEWIRRAAPIFEPMEFEYNGALCEATFDIMIRNGGFGPIEQIPESLQGSDVQFKFESPLHESAERRKGQKLLEAKQALVEMAQLDPGVVPMIDARTSLRDVLKSIGVPMPWTRSEADLEEMDKARQQQEQDQMAAQQAGVAAEVVETASSAAKNFSDAGAQQAEGA